MVLRVVEIKVFIYLIGLEYIKSQEMFTRYGDKMYSDQDYPAQISYGRIKHFENNADDGENMDYSISNKEDFLDHSPKRSSLESLFPSTSMKGQQMETNRGTIIPHYHTSNPMGCSCRLKPTVVDLGHDYYPRYVRSGICSIDSCRSNHRCSYVNYRLKVLKKRISEFKDFVEKPELPENLQKHWVADTVNVVVACHCS